METYFQCKLHGRGTIQVEDFGLVHAIVRMYATFLDGGIVEMLTYDSSSYRCPKCCNISLICSNI
ncbi:hypothetical protein H5410_002431 [Solanum commersonii]|uniref:Uncharacterized protein n=1 Tax=Solanum commersonii TaxID=4109 RepID=A0A9J6B2A8_SOLCO|nr:hypothetical protein H5410_002431 [Solanum commersonii]